MDPKPPSRGVLHAYVFFFTLPEPHLFCLTFAGSTSGRSCGNNEIIRGAMKLSAGGVRFMPRAKAEHTRALTIGLLHATSVSNMYRKVPMQTARNHTAVHVADEKGALPVVTLILFWRKMHISPLTMGRRCICSLQNEHCAAPALSGLEWETFACFPHVLCTEGLVYLKTAAINCDLKELANKNACVFGVVGQRSVGKLKARQRYSIGKIRAELPPSHTWRSARSAVEAAEFPCRILRFI